MTGIILIFRWTYNLPSVGHLPLSSVVPAYAILIVLAWAAALLVVYLAGPERLTKASATPGRVESR